MISTACSTEVPALRETMDATVARHVPKAATADPS